MLRSFVCCLLLLFGIGSAYAQTPPANYTYANTQNPTQMVTPVSPSGYATSPNYRGLDGQWHRASVVAMICSVDASGNPQLCPSGIDANTASVMFVAKNNGTISGTLTGANGANITLPDGTLHAGYLVADATVSAAAYSTGWGGSYSLTTSDGSKSLKVILDTLGNLYLVPGGGVTGGVLIGSSTYANLPTSEPVDGVSLICSDCTYNGTTGVQVHWSLSQSMWVTMDNQPVSSKNITAILQSPTLSGGVETYTPKDTPFSAGTSIPNTWWVSLFFQPKSAFIMADTQWTVCASGCTYSDVLSAWNAAKNSSFMNGATLTILIAHGTYNVTDQLVADNDNTAHIHILGDTQNKSAVVLNFTHTQGTNLNGIIAVDGGVIGLVDGLTITTPADGSGPLASTNTSNGWQTWNTNSYGAAIQSYGGGSSIKLGANMSLSNFYYEMVADDNGFIDGRAGGVDMYRAGDVNAMARGGGTIVCLNCHADTASDTNQLGSNFDAERGGHLYIDGSTGKNSVIQSIIGLTGGAIWAHHYQALGGLKGVGRGVWMTDNSSGEFTSMSVTGYAQGVVCFKGGFADLDLASISGNTEGVVLDGGHADGNNVSVKNNTDIGIQALHQGFGHFFGTLSNMSGNGKNWAVESAGQDTNGVPFTASSLVLQ